MGDAGTRPRTVVVVGPLPPPVEGASRVTSAVLAALAVPAAAAAASVRAVDTAAGQAPGAGSGPRYHLRRMASHVTACVWIATARVRGPVSVYVGGAGGLGLWYQLVVVALARALRARVLFHHHSFSYLDGPGRAVMRRLARCTGPGDVHVFLSDGMALAFAARYPCRSSALVVSNAAFVAARPRPRRGAGTPFRLVHVSNLTVEKGSIRVMEAFERLREASVAVSLTLIGGTTVPEVDRAVARLAGRYPDSFRSLGQRCPDVVGSTLDESDLFLFPSTYRMEAQPLVVLEALARGVPVLAGDRGTLRDLLPRDWLLAEPYDGLERRIETMIRTDWPSLSARAAAAFETSRTRSVDLSGPLLSR